MAPTPIRSCALKLRGRHHKIPNPDISHDTIGPEDTQRRFIHQHLPVRLRANGPRKELTRNMLYDPLTVVRHLQKIQLLAAGPLLDSGACGTDPVHDHSGRSSRHMQTICTVRRTYLLLVEAGDGLISARGRRR